MCDALSRNVPKLSSGVEILIALCMAHGRRQFVEVVANFPAECQYVLEMLGQVYGWEAETAERGLTPAERLAFHQQHSGPVMEALHGWLEAQLSERKTEPITPAWAKRSPTCYGTGRGCSPREALATHGLGAGYGYGPR